MEKVVTFLSVLAMCSLGVGVGLVFAAAGLIRRGERSPSDVLPVAFGLLFALAAVGGMAEQFGWAGALALVAWCAALAFAYRRIPRGAEPEPLAPAQGLPPRLPWLGRRVLAALPSAGLSLAYVLTLAGIALPWPDREELGSVLGVEFMVVAFALLLGPLAVLHFANARAEFVRVYVFAALLVFSLRPVGHDPGLLVSYGLALFGTYGGVVLSPGGGRALGRMVKRLAVAFTAFWTVVIAFRPPEEVVAWGGSSRGLAVGAVYFLLLAACEVAGAYDRRWWPTAWGEPGFTSAGSE